MRKMLLRICLGVGSPGGPCALEVSTGTEAAVTGPTVEVWEGIIRSAERLADSVSLNAAAFGTLRE